MTNSKTLFDEAKKYIPGGVNSPVRAFAAIGSTPRFIKYAYGSHVYDEDDMEYIDYIGSWGPMILGHNDADIRKAVMDAAMKGLSFGAATAIEVEMAKFICKLIPGVDMIRMVNSGTEAVMSAVRAARGYTKRDKIVKFNGCYHGHSDGLLVRAGSGVMTAGVPDSQGVPLGCTADTLTADYNNLDSVRELFDRFGEQIAAIIVEPVAANMGVVPPNEGFLEGLRSICDKYSAILIFDEVITGFRLSPAGAIGYYNVQPDMVTFGKIIGAGMPVGAYGGRRDIMEVVSPVGNVYQAGTLSGNPVAMAAGLTALRKINNKPEFYTMLNQKADKFFEDIKKIIGEHGMNYQVNHVGSIGSIFFTDTPVTDYTSAKTSDTAAFSSYCNKMFDSGIYIAPSQFEAMFLSSAHSDEDIKRTLTAIDDAL